ncbi:fluoride efflux transporter CrcB [Roseateles sp. BYS87W]|uniref:Fluoride-specific ion channel FluC n=1 Tax=Pelomonas baiyunensis TaxID=3299026 RepID=A0ABW7GW51_9BURK
MNGLAVAVGAAFGALARWQAGLLLNTRWWGFPLGTLAVNLIGGFLIGMALEWFGRQPNEVLKLLLVTGFLGGLTTFSAFSGESLALLKSGQLALAAAHTLAHVLGSLFAAWLGMRVVQALI